MAYTLVYSEVETFWRERDFKI